MTTSIIRAVLAPMILAAIVLTAMPLMARAQDLEPAQQAEDMLSIPAQDGLVPGPALITPSPGVPDSAPPPPTENLSAMPPAPGSASLAPSPSLTLEDGPQPAGQADPMTLLAQLPPEIQREIMREANYSFNFCRLDLMLSNFYNCSCVALDVIKRRIAVGPGNPLINALDDRDYAHCAYGPLAAGYAYSRCMDLYSISRLGSTLQEATCACASRTMARTFVQRPRANILYIDDMFNGIIVSCQSQARSGAIAP